ncbi:MAG: DNA gyrase subunit A [Fibrobacterota bacterium]|nr:MAG: DNA gyrase subunit A [Fibrobacterota bacterium]
MNDETTPETTGSEAEAIIPQVGVVGRVVPVAIDRELSTSYLRYSMSVIVARALPDVRDGLKPVHRRVLFAMDELSLNHDKPYKKSARIVGDVIGKYHPHGDVAVYDSLVRMAQDFSLRYMLVMGQGNFGSVDGDSPAAMRYTEARMRRAAELMLQDLDRDTVDFVNNYDESLKEPAVLPSAIPNLLVNGATGIAVGMATNMPPHNLREIVAACKAVLDNPEIAIEELLQYVKGPDFPTGAIIYGRNGARDAMLTGRGRVVVRAKHHFEEIGTRQAIIFTEIPYMVNKAKLLEKIAELVRDKSIEGIADLRDESDRDGMRIVVECKRDAHPDIVLNHLFKKTQLQDPFHVINLALVDGQPKVLNLKQLIHYYLEHRLEVIKRRAEHDLKKARERAHILEGYLKALDHLDEVIRLIRNSGTTDDARMGLVETFGFTEIQAQAILELQLRRLTGLERDKIQNEFNDLMVKIKYLEEVLASRKLREEIVADELTKVAEEIGDDRRTQIVDASDEVSMEDLVADEPMVVTVTHGGYVKRQPLTEYRAQGRGGKGVTGAGLKGEDIVDQIFVATAHAHLLFFTSLGRAHSVRVWDLPELGRTSQGTHIANLLELRKELGEKVRSVVPVRGFGGEGRIVYATRMGTINRMRLTAFKNMRKDGLIGIELDEGDELVTTLFIEGEPDLVVGTREGQAIRFPLSAFRDLGRGTRGVRGISLEPTDSVIGLVKVEEGTQLLTITEKGYGKRTEPSEYRVTNRGGKGIINLRVTEKNGPAVCLLSVRKGEEIMAITKGGMVIRTGIDDIRETGRDSQGVIVIRLDEGDLVQDVAHVVGEKEDEILPEAAGLSTVDAVDVAEDSVQESSPDESSPAGGEESE